MPGDVCSFSPSCPVKANVVDSALELLGPVCQVIRFGWRKKRHSEKHSVEFLGSLFSDPVNTFMCHPAGGKGWDVASGSICICN